MFDTDQRLKELIKSYLYEQYADDTNLQSFVEAFNAIAQGYLDWYNITPLGVYTNPTIGDGLLDWVAAGLYGLTRPILTNGQRTRRYGATNSISTNTLATNSLFLNRPGTVQPVNDDVFKRMITWHTYRGDGMQMTLPWLRKRVARFIFGDNGTDVSNDYLQYVRLTLGNARRRGSTNSFATNRIATNNSFIEYRPLKHVIVITLENGIISQQFQELLQQKWLNIPTQMTYLVKLI